MENKNNIIYLETGEDIASLASKVKSVEGDAVSFVVPRGASIAQSVVNLKILKREAEKAGKQVSLVTKDKISKNLASQVGLIVYQTVEEAKKAIPTMEGAGFAVTSKKIQGGIHINRYERDEEVEEDNQEVEGEITESPKLKEEIDEMLKEPERKASTAEGAGVRTESVGKENSKPKKTVSVPIDSDHKDDKTSLSGEVSPTGRKDKKMLKRKKIGLRKKPIIIIASLFLIAALVLSYIFVPRAEISVVLATQDISKDYEIVIDKNIEETNIDEIKIPGEEIVINQDLTKDFESTGEKEVGNKASGEITFYNYDYQSSDPKILPAGTALVAQTLTFITTEEVTIPGATATIVQGSIKVTPSTSKGKVEAQSPGTEYNIDASNFIVQSYSGSDRENVYGQSSSALSGGTSEKKQIVSVDDLERAKSEIKTELSGKVLESITQSADKEELKVIASSFVEEEVSFETDKQADEESANFTAKLTLKTTTIAFSESAFRALIVVLVEKDLEEDQMLVNPEKSDLDYDLLSMDNEAGTMKLKGSFSGKFGKDIEQGTVLDIVRNKKMGTVKTDIEAIEGVDEARVIIWPNFFTKVSSIESRIKINFDYNE